MNPTTLENIEAVYGKTEEQYLEEQELLAELAEEEAAEEAPVCNYQLLAEIDPELFATIDEEDLELPF